MKKIIFSMAIAMFQLTCFAQQEQTKTKTIMKPVDNVYTVFITKDLEETVAFYEQTFGFTRLFESSFFVLLQTSGERKFNIAFMDEDHPTAPPTPKAFNGSGSFLTLEVADAKAAYADVKKKGLKITYELRDEPWGQQRFGVLDPNGLWVDVVEQTTPVEGFWDNYIK
jgi:uncharacterized glyoxalase superfamily protein PhnB